jgi:hypothetical protein
MKFCKNQVLKVLSVECLLLLSGVGVLQKKLKVEILRSMSRVEIGWP